MEAADDGFGLVHPTVFDSSEHNLAAVAIADAGAACGAESRTLLTTAAAIQTLPPNRASAGHPVRIAGRVTAFDPVWSVLFRAGRGASGPAWTIT